MPEDREKKRPEEGAATPRAGWAYGLLAAAVVFGLFASGGPLQVAQGVMALVAGAGLLLLPPSVRLPRAWWGAAAATVVLSALAFLPRHWGPEPEWRARLEELGVATGGLITPHPAISFQHWIRLALTVAIGLWLLGHRLTDRGHARVLMVVSWAAGVYAAVSVALAGSPGAWAWDPVDTFGLFANRSHTATLLVIGMMAALTAATYHVRHRRGGRAALATLPGMLCTGALLGYSVSRAGLLLLALGLASWLAGQAARGRSRQAMLIVAAIAAVLAALFWFSDADIKSRLARQPKPYTETEPAATAAAPGLDLGVQDDGRWLIFSDTFSLIRDSWFTGIGRGLFEHVIPQYRRLSACDNRCLHPESDWLLLASESGVPCALALAALVGMVAFAAARDGWQRRGWSLRWGGLIAAVILPVHGLFDTPGHVPALDLLAILLVAAAFRPPSNDPCGTASRASRRLFQAAGSVAIAGGASLLFAEFANRPSPVVAPFHAFNEAARLAREDFAAQDADPTGHAAAADAHPEKDLLRQAIAATEKGLRFAPLDATLHYQRGMLALHFDDLESLTLQSLDAQRLLEPMPPGVALRQAGGWASVDPERTVDLWSDALRRTQATAAVSKWIDPGVALVPRQIIDQAAVSESLMGSALTLLRPQADAVRYWAGKAPTSLLDTHMPSLLESAETSDRAALLKIWQSRGTPGAAEAHRARP